MLFDGKVERREVAGSDGDRDGDRLVVDHASAESVVSQTPGHLEPIVSSPCGRVAC